MDHHSSRITNWEQGEHVELDWTLLDIRNQTKELTNAKPTKKKRNDRECEATIATSTAQHCLMVLDDVGDSILISKKRQVDKGNERRMKTS
jgi:hypothetical protein